MADNDIQYKDVNSVPFYPEASDQGNSVRRTMVGAKDGALVTVGALADVAATADTGSFSVIALVKRSLARWTSLFGLLPASLGAKAGAASFSVVPAADHNLATAARQPALGTAGVPSIDVLSLQGVAGGKALDTTVQGTPTSRSGSITAGGSYQQLMAANTARRGWRIQNQSTGDLYVNELGNASAAGDSMKVTAGALYETPPHFVSTGVISIFGATTGQLFYAREF